MRELSFNPAKLPSVINPSPLKDPLQLPITLPGCSPISPKLLVEHYNLQQGSSVTSILPAESIVQDKKPRKRKIAISRVTSTASRKDGETGTKKKKTAFKKPKSATATLSKRNHAAKNGLKRMKKTKTLIDGFNVVVVSFGSAELVPKLRIFRVRKLGTLVIHVSLVDTKR